MDVQILNPLEYPDWDALLLQSGDQTFFHTAAWAGVLEKSYRFKPLYFTGLEEGRIVFLMPLMEVRSFLTGRSATAKKFQANRVMWLDVNLALAVLMVLIGGFLRFVGRDLKGDKPEMQRPSLIDKN